MGRTLPEMNVMLREFIIVFWLFSSTDFCSAGQIIIERENSKDFFTIPPSKCAGMDNCGTYNAMTDSQACHCYCGEQSATFSVYNNRWTCLENEVARIHLGKLSNCIVVSRKNHLKLVIVWCLFENSLDIFL